MLATFTANLAAFLTVERMQTPVQSLDQLARQSRINYTVGKTPFRFYKYLSRKKNKYLSDRSYVSTMQSIRIRYSQIFYQHEIC